MKALPPLVTLSICVALSFAASQKPAHPQAKDNTKPALALRANPPIAFAPVRINLSAQLTGVEAANEDFYCPTIEWDWGDGTISAFSCDCEPFQPNKSEIQHAFTTQHVYKVAGAYTVSLVLKKMERVVAVARTDLIISGMPGDAFDR